MITCCVTRARITRRYEMVRWLSKSGRFVGKGRSVSAESCGTPKSKVRTKGRQHSSRKRAKKGCRIVGQQWQAGRLHARRSTSRACPAHVRACFSWERQRAGRLFRCAIDQVARHAAGIECLSTLPLGSLISNQCARRWRQFQNIRRRIARFPFEAAARIYDTSV